MGSFPGAPSHANPRLEFFRQKLSGRNAGRAGHFQKLAADLRSRHEDREQDQLEGLRVEQDGDPDLPPTHPLHIVSLLGQKRDGFSEYDYYPFQGSNDVGVEPTFQEWLDCRYGHRFVVHEFPTVDATGLPLETVEQVGACLCRLLKDGMTVLLMNSAGAERTARVCEKMGYKAVGPN